MSTNTGTGESAADPLWDIRSATLAHLRAAEDQLRRYDPFVDPLAVSVPAWNALQTRWNRAADAVIHDAELMAELRRALPRVVNARDRRMLAQLLLVPLDELPPEAEAILADPRVSLTADQVEVAPAIYLVDHDGDPDSVSLYAADDTHPDESEHDLTRMGGLPTAGPWDRPDTVFLLQIDLSTLCQATAVHAFIATTVMPTEGLLQLFHTTTGDSRTDSHIPGGGATVLYVPEALLAQRSRADGEALFPVRRISMEVLPAFRFGLAATTDEALAQVIALQTRADTIAREATWYREGDARSDPFDEALPTSSRMLGSQWFDFDASAETRNVLEEDLPLRSPRDRHILLFDVSGDTPCDGVFGDDARLEIWIRESDLAARDFGQVVSFIRGT